MMCAHCGEGYGAGQWWKVNHAPGCKGPQKPLVSVNGNLLNGQRGRSWKPSGGKGNG